MQRYKNLGGDSGVVAFELGEQFIVIEFRDGSRYLYTAASTGAADIATTAPGACRGRTVHLHQPARPRPLRTQAGLTARQ